MERGIRYRTGVLLTSAVLLASLAVAAVAAPAAAANPKVTIVQGIPGIRVDICIGNNEIKSGVPYGAHFQRSVLPGVRTLKVFKQDPRKCRGTQLLQRNLALAADADITVVATKVPSKLVIFDNLPGGTVAIQADMYFRHAADIGPATIGFRYQSINPLTPAAYTPFEKGDQRLFELSGYSISAVAQQLGGTIATSRSVELPLVNDAADTFGNRHVEFILVGTTRKNARFVVIDRPPAIL